MPPVLVTPLQIAQRLGVSRNTVRAWQQRPWTNFPKPYVKGPGQTDTPYWDWVDVKAWAIKTQRLLSLSDFEELERDPRRAHLEPNT